MQVSRCGCVQMMAQRTALPGMMPVEMVTAPRKRHQETRLTVLPSVINFNPALKFDGSTDNLLSPSLFTGTGVNNAQVYAVSITDVVQNQYPASVKW